MIISKTPLRISFFGGGTDYPHFYEEHGGEVVSTTIDQYVYVTVAHLNPLFDYRLRVAYSRTELVKTSDEVEHPSVKHCLKHMGMDSGVEVAVMSDLPARSGLGSSSSFTVGLLHSLHAYAGRLVDQETLAREAIHVEQKLIKERVGSQDQVAAALGGFRKISFSKKEVFRADPLPLNEDRKTLLQNHLMLFFTGITRYADVILQEQCSRVSDNHSSLKEMRGHVQEGCGILCNENRDISDFGRLLHEGWRLKQSLSSKISNPTISEAYNTALKAGAVGGKLLGAGGGGFLLIFAAPDRQDAVRAAMTPMMQVPFRFEDGGSRLIYYRK